MALKDWKKMSDMGFSVYWELPNKKKPSSEIPLLRVHVSHFPEGSGEGFWNVNIMSESKEMNKDFKTKSGAFRFAKKYMEAH